MPETSSRRVLAKGNVACRRCELLYWPVPERWTGWSFRPPRPAWTAQDVYCWAGMIPTADLDEMHVCFLFRPQGRTAERS